jgi:hypothetical protein
MCLTQVLMLRISSETGGKLACRQDWLLHPHGCEAHGLDNK